MGDEEPAASNAPRQASRLMRQPNVGAVQFALYREGLVVHDEPKRLVERDEADQVAGGSVEASEGLLRLVL